MLCMVSFSSFAQCCLTNSLIINTGYDPMGAGAGIAGGLQGGTPVPDPHWKVCVSSWGLSHDVAGTGLIPVVPVAPADVIQPAPGWVAFPSTGPGGAGEWINSFNGYHYIHTTDSNYRWTISRQFTLHCDADVTFDFSNITADNWLMGGGIDGPGCNQPGTGYIPIPGITLTPYCCYGLYGGIGVSVFGGNPGILYSLAPFTVNLAAGVHTIYFSMMNDNTGSNNIGFLVQGKITTTTPSIVPENVICASPGICVDTLPAICIGATVVLPNHGITGGTWVSDNTAIATVNSGGTAAGMGAGATNITYNVPTGMGCPYIYRVEVQAGGTVTNSTNISICASDGPVPLHAAEGYASYLWNNGYTTDSVLATSSGIYWVQATSDCGLYSDTFHVTLKPSPLVALPNDTTICTNITMVLSSPQPPGAIYNWSTGSHAPSISVNQAGIYNLTVTVDGCSNSDTVELKELSPPSVGLGRDTILCNADELEIKLPSRDGNYLWSNGERGQTITISEPGTYWVVISNKCGKAGDTITVDFGVCNVGLPTGFSPNGDGINDVLYVRGQGITTLELQLYNRWGQLIFETTDQKKGWDGTFNGQPQPMDAYAYVLKALLIDGVSKLLKGNVTLIR